MKEYGGHKYEERNGNSDCEYGCGCWMGPFQSGGPTGLYPKGACPKNPKDGKLLGGNADYDRVVTQRIQNLESRLHKAESSLKKIKLNISLSNPAKDNHQLFVDILRLTDLSAP